MFKITTLFFLTTLISFFVFLPKEVLAGCSWVMGGPTSDCTWDGNCYSGCECSEIGGGAGAQRKEWDGKCHSDGHCWVNFFTGPSCAPADCGCGGGPSRPCGDCIPSGCGFTALPLEKKFVIDNKTSEKIQQLFQQSVQFNRLTIAVENSSGVSDGKTFLASIFEPSLKTIRNFLSRLII